MSFFKDLFTNTHWHQSINPSSQVGHKNIVKFE